MTLYGGIEAGGTKFVCAVGDQNGSILAEMRFPTTTPEETIGRAADFFTRQKRVAALGIASFGPVDLRTDSPTWGYITSTPKPGWGNIDLAGPLGQALGVPVGFDTDVNGAALGEHRWGAARDLHTFLYLTIGTGIGGGAMVNGKLLHGAMHPEMGHIILPRDPQRDPYAGFCPYHENCFEGLAAGPALEKRWGQRGETLPPEHPAWELEAQYIALGLAAYTAIFSPQRIILGGGVMAQAFLMKIVREEVLNVLNGYLQWPTLIDAIDTYIVPPGLGGQAGVKGALALAEWAHQKENAV